MSMTAVADMAALARQQTSQALDRGALGTEAVLARVTRIQEIKMKVMKRNVHFGPPFPGSDKDTLLKPGGELLLMTFQIAAVPEVEDLSTPDCARYRVRMRAVHQQTGEVLGEFTAEASSDEEKRRWRGAVCDAEWDEAPSDQKRKLWKKRRDGEVYTVIQIRTSPADVANDVLAMAQKRAMIGLTRQVLACSDLFDQNLEDLPDYLKEPAVDEATGKPQRASAAATNGNGSGAAASTSSSAGTSGDKPKHGVTDPVQITAFKAREIKKKAGGTTTKYEITAQGIVYSTFLERLAKAAEAIHLAKGYARLTWKLNEPYGRDLEKVEEAAAPRPAKTSEPTREREPGDDDGPVAGDNTPSSDQLSFDR
jgi:hypothetical protein